MALVTIPRSCARLVLVVGMVLALARCGGRFSSLNESAEASPVDGGLDASTSELSDSAPDASVSDALDGGSDTSAAWDGEADAPGVPVAWSTALVTTAPGPKGPCLIDAKLNPPNAEFVIIASQAVTCSQTLPPNLVDFFDHSNYGPFPTQWEVCIPLPVSSLVLGTVALDTPVDAVAESGDNMASEFGLSLEPDVTMQITDLTQDSATIVLNGTKLYLDGTLDGGGSADGTYVALRCH
jgi:hypothetical protein